jgi:hypothetical protein
VLAARPAAISFEGANPRHEHEWRLFDEGLGGPETPQPGLRQRPGQVVAFGAGETSGDENLDARVGHELDQRRYGVGDHGQIGAGAEFPGQ